MERSAGKYIFGPVPSRRLGLSLGVDLVPHKVCTLDCAYCQVGRTTDQRVERGDFVPVEEVIAELGEALARGPRPDYVTLSGSGEPTLNARLGEIIDRIHAMTDVPVAIITNGTLLTDPAVRREVARADLVVPSLDAGDEKVYRRLKRPAAEHGLTLAALVDGLVAFRREFRGPLWLEVFFVAGVNDTPDQVEKLRRLIERIGPDRVQLNTAARPPAEAGVEAVPPERLAEIAAGLGPRAEVIAPFKGQADRAAGGLQAEAVLAMIRRRPVTAEDIAAGLGAHPAEVVKALGLLLESRRIRRTDRGGKSYFEAAEKA
jgi:wyosine [tRNA(Phe)-imidazoG37] synthetase (radical SAM superfamily)